MYRVGYPAWKLLARMGVPVLVRVEVHFDDESQSYWADSPDLDGLVVSGLDLNELRSEVSAAAGVLLGLHLGSATARVQTELRIRDNALLCAAP